ncbi:unnamed protein product [Lactuca virosa]|uniref:Uncharacterized protein n=1 Tax=Lactuca virosa TaxID=75947 RepID=A0AAU9PLW9_9ASTR|nr:unnamed protein product [Lactuca virosa]
MGEEMFVERESFSVISRRHFCYGGEVLVFDSSEFVEGSVNVNHSICVLIFSSGCELSSLCFQSFTDIAIFKGKQ